MINNNQHLDLNIRVCYAHSPEGCFLMEIRFCGLT